MKPDYNYILFQGNLEKLSSFSIINRILTGGLKDLGYKVNEVPSDSTKKMKLPGEIPDLYIFHGHPYDYVSAPGRFNIFILNYEYFQIKREDNILIERLNNYFDLVLVSTNFVKEILLKNGLKTPINLLPWGVDRTEFNPEVKPKKIRGLKGFIFIYAGVFTERKGIDILMEAFINEFSADEDVSLVIKEAMRWKHYEPWIEKVMYKSKTLKSVPKIIHINKAEKSIAGYFATCDVGVFPFRGEGFGLPILECIASGRRVIVTKGTGPIDFCTKENALFINAQKRSSNGKLQLEPDTRHLGRLMREAFDQGRPDDRERRKIARSISDFTWGRTLEKLKSVVDHALTTIDRNRGPRMSISGRMKLECGSPRVCYAYYEKGLTSWRKTSARVDGVLRRSFKNYISVGFRTKPVTNRVDLVVGQSGFSMEQFIRAGRYNPGALNVLYRESGPIENMLKVTNRERKKCGVEKRNMAPIELWRNQAELKLTDHLLLFSDISKKLFMDSGYPEEKINVIRLGITVHKPIFRKRRNKIRFLFVGTDSYRKGIRILLEAWDQLKLRRAELVCITDDLLQSGFLLSYIVRNDNIKIKSLMHYKKFLAEYQDVDCLLLPSFEDVFPFVIGEGMGYGKPAILSTDTGISEILTNKHDGLVVDTGSVESLKEAILYMYDNGSNIRVMGEAAYETAVKYSWKRFEKSFSDLIFKLYDERI